MNGEYGTYLVTQEDLSRDRSTVEIVEAAIAGGVDVVQLREKHATARRRYELGRELRRLTAAAGVDLIVNDRVDVAAVISAITAAADPEQATRALADAVASGRDRR